MEWAALLFLYYLLGLGTFQLVQTLFKDASTEALLVGMTISVAGIVGLIIMIFSSSLPHITAYRIAFAFIVVLISTDVAALGIIRNRKPFDAI